MSKIPPDSGKQTSASQTSSGSQSAGQQATTGVQVASTSILPQLARDISPGDIINFTVRGRTPEGMGILYFLGQLVHAKIPEHLKTGDRVKAQIGYENQQILFRILSVLGKGNEVSLANSSHDTLQQNPVALTQDLQKKVEEMLFTISRFLPDLHGTIPANLSHTTSNIPSLFSLEASAGSPLVHLKNILNKLFEILPSQEEMTQSATFLPKLQNIFKVSTNETLKVISLELKDFLQSHNLPPEHRFILTLLDQLQTLSSGRTAQNLPTETFRLSLEKIIRALEQEMSKDTKTSAENISKEAYQTTLKVTVALLKETYMNPESRTDSIRKVIDYLQANLLNSLPADSESGSQVPLKILGEVKALVTTIEQFTYTQELLLRLEPILQAMRQPELLLFPFLFQGFFSFGELLVDPDAKRSPSDEKQEDTEKEQKEADKPIIQYHAMLPLPHLGIVRLNTLQSNEEITLNLSFEDKEKADFVKEQIHDLRSELSKLGFSKLEISSRGDGELLSITESGVKVV